MYSNIRNVSILHKYHKPKVMSFLENKGLAKWCASTTMWRIQIRNAGTEWQSRWNRLHKTTYLPEECLHAVFITNRAKSIVALMICDWLLGRESRLLLLPQYVDIRILFCEMKIIRTKHVIFVKHLNHRRWFAITNTQNSLPVIEKHYEQPLSAKQLLGFNNANSSFFAWKRINYRSLSVRLFSLKR